MGYVNNVWVWRECFERGVERPRLRQLLWVKLAGEAVGQCGTGIAGWQGGRQSDCAEG